MKALPIICFFFGLLIQLIALFGEHVKEIPFALRVVAPAYVRAEAGFETLYRDRRLSTTNEGFAELSRIVIQRAYERYHIPKGRVIDLKVEAIAPVGETISLGTGKGDIVYSSEDVRFWVSSKTNRLVTASGNVQQMPDFLWHQTELRDKVEELATPNVLRFCFGMFFLGSVVEIIAFLWERAESQPDKSKEEAPKEHSDAAANFEA